jgi:hypothetical protein
MFWVVLPPSFGDVPRVFALDPKGFDFVSAFDGFDFVSASFAARVIERVTLSLARA